ncbi:MAG: glycine cleavage system aminomethyltransferase GcvT [Candidatus Hydrogenedentota bacterium]
MDIKKTPLTDAHRALGAKMGPFAGYDMPIQYEGILAEHKAVRTKCGIFDVSHMGHCLTSDPGISRILSRPLDKISLGKSCYMLIMNPDGGIIDDCIAYRMKDDLWHIVLNASRKEIDVAALGNVTPRFELAMIALQGPEAISLAGELCPRRGFATNVNVLGVDVTLVARTGYTGEDGYEFVLPAESAGLLWKKLMDNGAAPCGLGVRDLLRIEAGLPLYGMDISEETDPYETGLAFAVDLDRPEGSFLAREALLRRKDGPRRRAGLKLPKGAVPRHDYPVADASGRTVGKVTSGTFSPLLDCGIALALVEKSSRPNAVRIRGTDCIAEEVALPFYRSPGRKKA